MVTVKPLETLRKDRKQWMGLRGQKLLCRSGDACSHQMHSCSVDTPDTDAVTNANNKAIACTASTPG